MVAILTAAMKVISTFLLAAFLFAIPVAAQDWSVGVATGPFIFGDFAERTLRVGTPEGGSTTSTDTLSAGTRAGLAVDIEHRLSERLSFRVEGTFTEAPLALGDGQFELEAGDLDVGTFTLPLVFHINPHGSFRFHVLAGPAYALYHIDARENANDQPPIFEGTRGRWGYAAGVGLAWHINERFAIEAGVTDLVTQSPIQRSDFGGSLQTIDIPQTQNVHSTIGLRVKF
ncbi:MAG TPA: outer membrane beta-barrel protein [Thermoanaerobaculia bacterium]|nr:outer membrane beta-barrel protein [Thermoanaerobaculia bacterium]